MPYKERTILKNNVMWFKKPAENWLQSLPIGNGHIGCMINNDPDCDILSLNDDTLWSGYEHNYCKKDFKEHITQVKGLMIKGNRVEAEKIVETHLTNRFTQAYMPLGDIIIKSQAGTVENYRRELDMEKGIIHARYTKNGSVIETETFVCYPDDVLIYRMEAQAPTDLELSFQSLLMHEATYDSDGFTVRGCAPSDIAIADVGNFYSQENKASYTEAEKPVKFAARAHIHTDGLMTAYVDRLSITDARKISILYSSATSFDNGQAYEDRCLKTVLSASEKNIDTVREAHIDDHSSLFNRMHIDLGGDEASCDDRHTRMSAGQVSNADISLLFHYGRYLLIGSSRKGTQAANLQGIWNKDLIPPWWCGYTLNINLQMNYWLADRTNLSDCFDPFLEYVNRLCESGKRTAKEDYGTEGAVAHHQSDIWAHSTPVGYDLCKIPLTARYVMWNMALPWLCIQLFDHYLYTLDEQYLKNELLPIMHSTAEFILHHFTEIDGRLYNIPSTSPENMYRDVEGNELAICNMSAMDIGISKDFFKAYIFTCKRFGENELAHRCEIFSQRIADDTISQNGILLEWDGEFAEPELGHRHFSMLFGVYPGSHLLSSKYIDAAKKSLYRRLKNGSGQTGWSAVWAIALLARFGECEAAYEIIQKLMSENIHENMFGAHPPDLFQIDANFGFTAAICELILQEYDGVIKLLPALPRAMETGSINGLKIYSGHVVSLRWEASRVASMDICAAADDEIVINAVDLISDDSDYTICPEGIRVRLIKGNTHTLYLRGQL